MTLAEGQVQIRDLVMGPGTPYTLMGFNPFNRTVRADQGGARAWNDGTWSGAEFLDETAVPIRILTRGGDRSAGAWLADHLPLMAAFDAVGDGTEEVELRFVLGGTEYLMFGRPRMVDPDTEIIGTGKAMTEAAFVANNPRIYSAVEQVVVFQLPSFSSGFALPIYLPLHVEGVKVSGEADLLNSGLAKTPLRLRIDGPVSKPLLTLRSPDGVVENLKVHFSLIEGQWLDIDTASRVVLLNSQANRRGQISGEFFQLSPGTSTLFFTSSIFNEIAQVTARWRFAW